jgi:hypothetical protein
MSKEINLYHDELESNLIVGIFKLPILKKTVRVEILALKVHEKC